MPLFTKRQMWVAGIALLVGIGGILYGYDIGVVAGALGFMQQTIPMNNTQTGLIVGAVLAGGLLGTLLTGPLADLWGRRKMIAIACLIFISGVFLIFLAQGFWLLLIARLVLGVGVGIISVAIPLYVAELVPANVRGKYVTFFQLFLTFGILLAYLVDLFFIPSENWRAMFGVVLIPAGILLFSISHLPESPRWLLSQGRKREAWQVLLSTHTKSEAELALISIDNSLLEIGGGWRELFSARLKFPLLLAVSIAILNQLTGINSFLQYAPSIFKTVDLESDYVAMLGSFCIGIINFLCTLVAVVLIDRVGRRPLMLMGLAGICISEIFLGYVNYIHLAPHVLAYLSLMGLLGFIFSYALGPGVVVWLAISELLPTRVRGHCMAFCLFCNSLAATFLATTFLDLKARFGMTVIYWLCAGFSLVYGLIVLFFLPETKAKSLEDIQLYFLNRNRNPHQNKYKF